MRRIKQDNSFHEFIILQSALGCFSGEFDLPDEDEIPSHGELSNCVEELVEYYADIKHADEKVRLKQLIISVYLQDKEIWHWLNSNDGWEENEPQWGGQCAALTLWQETFPDIFYQYEGDIDVYHPEMLKLLVKKSIWDVLFPGEELPNYQEPESGYLPHFKPLGSDG